VKISFRDAVRLAASVRPTGTTGAVAGIRTVVRFGVFFVGQVARAFLTPGRIRGPEVGGTFPGA
jgi:hypothetical protein